MAAVKYPPEELLSRLQVGEDSEWEFEEVRFGGTRLDAPVRNDIADEIAAYANSQGGTVVFGVTDQGDVQGITHEQMDALDRVLVEVCTQSIEPPLAVETHRRELEGKHVVVVAVPRGYAQHDSPGGSYHRIGSSKIKMTGDQRLRLAQERAMSRFTWLDKTAVPDTGFHSLDEGLWKRLVSVHGMGDPEVALEKMGLLVRDERGTLRASVAGLLLCARAPETWLDHACVTATCYRGSDRAATGTGHGSAGTPRTRRHIHLAESPPTTKRLPGHPPPHLRARGSERVMRGRRRPVLGWESTGAVDEPSIGRIRARTIAEASLGVIL